MAEVRRSGKAVMVRVVVGHRNGKPIRKSKTFPKGTRQTTIDTWERSVKYSDEAMALALEEPARSKPFDEVIDAYLKHKKPSLAPRTHKEYSKECRLYLRGRWGAIGDITTKDIQALIDDYSHLAPRGQQKLKTQAAMIFNYAIDRGHIIASPVTRSVRLPKLRKVKSYNVLSIEQYDAAIERLWGLPEGCGVLMPDVAGTKAGDDGLMADGMRLDDGRRRPVDGIGLLTLFYTGLRISELLALQPKHIGADSLRVEQSLDGLHGNRKVGEPKSEHSYRTIAIPERLASTLLAYPASEGFIFPLKANAYRVRLKKLCEGMALPAMNLHDVRHSHCTYLLARGVNVLAVSRRLGHHSPAFTLERYGHLIPSMDEKLKKILN